MQKNIKIGLIATKINPIVGQGSYSPGLQYDAQIYASELNKLGASIINISPAAAAPIENCDVLIGFEEIGGKELVSAIRRRKKTAPLIVILVPNLEVMNPNRGNWIDTLENLDLIDIYIAKTPGLKEIIEKWLVEMSAAAAVHIIHHNTAVPFINASRQNAPQDNSQNAPRSNIIHFAGASYMKNTLECCRASIELIKKHRPKLNKLIVKITNWPNGKAALGIISFEDVAGPREFAELKELCQKNADYVDLRIGGFISDAEKAELYSSACLAICCSRAEGFGHYIVEAAFYGCQVITTDGVPMREILKIPGTFALARPVSESKCNFGVKYETPAAAIVKAADSLNFIDYDEERSSECAKNCEIINAEFERDMAAFYAVLVDLISSGAGKLPRKIILAAAE